MHKFVWYMAAIAILVLPTIAAAKPVHIQWTGQDFDQFLPIGYYSGFFDFDTDDSVLNYDVPYPSLGPSLASDGPVTSNLSGLCAGAQDDQTARRRSDVSDDQFNMSVRDSATGTIQTPDGGTVQCSYEVFIFIEDYVLDNSLPWPDRYFDYEYLTNNGSFGSYSYSFTQFDRWGNEIGSFADSAGFLLTSVRMSVPEPTSLALLGLGLVGMGLRRRKVA